MTPTTILAALDLPGFLNPKAVAVVVVMGAFLAVLYAVFRVRSAFFRRGAAMALDDGRRVDRPAQDAEPNEQHRAAAAALPGEGPDTNHG